MTTSRRSCRCLSRRHLARISIIDMFGLSSMNSGASETSPIVRASWFQSSRRSWPERMLCSGTLASAESRRMVISLRPISREKITDVSPCLMDADRHDVEAERGVVGRDHGRPGQVEVFAVVDLHATNRYRGDRAYVADEPRRRGA